MKHLIGIGDSHLHALTWALREFETEHPNLVRYTEICLLDAPYFPSFTNENGVRIANPALVSGLRDNLTQTADISVFLCLGGSEHFRWSLTPGPNPFDFIDPVCGDQAEPLGQLVPYGLFMAFAHESFRFMRIMTEFIRGFTTLPLVQLLAPPPVRDLASMVATNPDVAGQIGEFGVSPLHFRLKMWRAAARALEDVCAEVGVACMGPPEGAIDAQGCLRDDMIGDMIHGNIAWGRLQMQRLLARAGVATETV